MANREHRLAEIVGWNRARAWLSPLLLMSEDDLRKMESQKLSGTAPSGTPAACWIRDELEFRGKMSAHEKLVWRKRIQSAW